MSVICCLGDIKPELSEQFRKAEIEFFVAISLLDLKSQIDLRHPVLCLIEESFAEACMSASIDLSMIIFFTNASLHVKGYEYIRRGALDFLSCVSLDDAMSVIKGRLEDKQQLQSDFLDRVVAESNYLYQAIVEVAPILILLVNQEGQILIANQEAKIKMQLQDEDDRLVHYVDSVLYVDFLNEIIKSLSDNQIHTFQCSVTAQESSTPILWHFTSFDQIIGETVLLFGQDISTTMELRKKEFFQSKSLLILNEKLERANKYLDQFTGMVSHDIKNGLNRILGFTRILSTHVGEQLNDEDVDILNRVMINTESMAEMVDRMLNFASSRGSRLAIKRVFIDDLLRQVLKNYEVKFKEVDGAYQIESTPTEIEADVICMKQVFENLISNSIKYRSVERRLQVSLEVVDLGADVLITIQDNGIGIKPGDEDKLFQEYYREEGVAKKVEGFGIGLSTVKTLLDSHNGVIWAEPDIAEGSVFNIQLPKVQ